MKGMRTITLEEVAAHKKEAVRHYLAGVNYTNETRVQDYVMYIENMNDVEYMNSHNELVARETRKAEQAKAKQVAISAERKATRMSKKAYRAEYDRLMSEYRAGNRAAKEEAKKIQRFAF